MKLNKDGQRIWAQQNFRFQANAMAHSSGGIAVVGHSGDIGGALDLIDPSTGTKLKSIDMPAPKYNMTTGDYAAGQFAHYQYKDTNRQCDDAVLVECWGATVHPSDRTKVLVACGTGIEPGMVGPPCDADPRNTWRSYTMAVDVTTGKPAWISLDNFSDSSNTDPTEPGQSPRVSTSAGEWIAVNKNFDKVLVFSDNDGIATFMLDGNFSSNSTTTTTTTVTTGSSEDGTTTTNPTTPTTTSTTNPTTSPATNPTTSPTINPTTTTINPTTTSAATTNENASSGGFTSGDDSGRAENNNDNQSGSDIYIKIDLAIHV
jgi:hypothetical protein